MQPSIPWSSSVSVFVIKSTVINHSLKCIVPFSFAVPLLSLIAIFCHSLSLVVLLVVTLSHLLYWLLPLAVIRCHSLYHSLSLDVPLVCLFINNPKALKKKENVEKKNKGNDKTFSLKWKYIKMKANNLLIKKEFAIVFRALMKSLISKIYYI